MSGRAAVERPGGPVVGESPTGGTTAESPNLPRSGESPTATSSLDPPLDPGGVAARPHGARSVEPAADPLLAELERARPPIGEEPVILGLSRHSHSRLGSRLFTLFFVFVFGLITVQMFVALLMP
jgi:hypothetical protein